MICVILFADFDDGKNSGVKATLSVVVILGYALFILFAIRFYIRVYERLSVYNNPVVAVHGPSRKLNLSRAGRLSQIYNSFPLECNHLTGSIHNVDMGPKSDNGITII